MRQMEKFWSTLKTKSMIKFGNDETETISPHESMFIWQDRCAPLYSTGNFLK